MPSKKTTSRAALRDGRPLSPLPERPDKPVIGMGTWAAVLLLIAVIGFALLYNKQKAQQATETTPTPGSSLLFTSEEGTVSGIKIEDIAGSSVEVARNESGAWVLKAPTEALADQAAAEAAATQIAALRVISNVSLGLDVVGLDKPSYTITITFTGGKTHKLTVGSATPIQTGYYVQLDGGMIQIVDKEGLDALLGMLTNPPYLATPTPLESPTPEASSTPTPDLTLTPAATMPTATGTETKSP